MENRGTQLSTRRKQYASRNSGEAAENESREQGLKEKYLKGKKFECDARGGRKGLPHTSGMMKMREEMLNFTALPALNSLSSEQPAAIQISATAAQGLKGEEIFSI